MTDNRGFLEALIRDGRPLIGLAGLALFASGVFALFLSATRQFLPHDVAFLGMSPESLCSLQQCKIVHFMIHDRVSFGGALVAIGLLYLWLAQFPLGNREPWAWWALAISGVTGFGSFLAYLGYGYLDTWHGYATLALLPVFLLGIAKTYPGHARLSFKPSTPLDIKSPFGIGRILILGTALGLIGAGATIMTIGATSVFVPEDLAFMGLDAKALHTINPRLVPLIAHDRAGFGGGVLTAGLLVFACGWFGRPSRSLWQALALAGIAGFGSAVGIHPIIGYVDFFHLAPAVTGAIAFALAMILCHQHMCCKQIDNPPGVTSAPRSPALVPRAPRSSIPPT